MIGYDSDNIDDIPSDVELVLFYNDGEPGTATAHQLARFANTPKQSITRRAGSPGYWGDVEPGCIWPISAAVDVWRYRLVTGLYVDESNWATLRAAIFNVAIFNVGLSPPPYWVAAYPNTLPTDPAVPQQWIDRGCVMWQFADPPKSGGHYDLSVTAPGFPPAPQPQPLPLEDDVARNILLPAGMTHPRSIGLGPKDTWVSFSFDPYLQVPVAAPVLIRAVLVKPTDMVGGQSVFPFPGVGVNTDLFAVMPLGRWGASIVGLGVTQLSVMNPSAVDIDCLVESS